MIISIFITTANFRTSVSAAIVAVSFLKARFLIREMENSTESTLSETATFINTSTKEAISVESLPAHQASLLLWKIVPPLMLTFGTIGNVLSIMVLTKKSIRNNTSAIYLSTLAVSDLFSLYTGLLRQWISYTFDYDIRNFSVLICKMHLFLVYFSLDFSAWLLVAVTFDRVIKTCLPHVANTMLTRKTAAISASTVGLILFLLNCHVFYGMGTVTKVVNSTVTVEHCTYRTVQYKEFFQTIWPWIDFAVYSCLPFILLLAGNLVIMVRLFKSFKATHVKIAPKPSTRLPAAIRSNTIEPNKGNDIPSFNIRPPSPTGSQASLNQGEYPVMSKSPDFDSHSAKSLGSSTNTSVVRMKSPSTIDVDAVSTGFFSTREVSHNEAHGSAPEPNKSSQTYKKQTAKNKMSSTSCTLIILNTVFLVSTTPISVFLIGYPYWSEKASSHKMAALNLIWSLVNILMYTNNAINFLLYCLSGSKFRNELKQIFQKCCKLK